MYNQIPGDGRELVVMNPAAVKLRAEDGRSVAGVNISTFINNLPMGRPTSNFYTTDASGSTSQAAGLLEVCVGVRAVFQGAKWGGVCLACITLLFSAHG